MERCDKLDKLDNDNFRRIKEIRCNLIEPYNDNNYIIPTDNDNNYIIPTDNNNIISTKDNIKEEKDNRISFLTFLIITVLLFLVILINGGY